MSKLHDLSQGEVIEIDLGPGDGIDLAGGKVLVRLLEKGGRRARISIQAERSIPIRIFHELDKR